MTDAEFTAFISSHKVFAQVRADSAESALRASEAAIVGGIRIIEVVLSTPGGLRVISDLRHRYGDRTVVGAGGLRTNEQVDRAIKAGVQFVSMPNTDMALIEFCATHRVPVNIGALTPTEVANAASIGVALVTVFPAFAVGGPAFIAALTSRMPDLLVAASGGVGSENIVDYFAAGAFAIGVGSSLFNRGDLQNQNYAAIAERARGIRRLAGVA
jgi:2-dehydro-3-deoxyphosphogluconate aldolase/(4S)-4-hydroxy-2-oxoglutarate aldolase